MALDGILLDLDGTLIDSISPRVRAWGRAFDRGSYVVGHDRIEAEILKDATGIVSAVLGRDAEESRGVTLRRSFAEEYARIVESEGMRVSEGAHELLRDLHRRGVETALATHATDEELGRIERATGVEWRKVVDVVVSGADLPASHGPLDAICTALTRLGMTAAQCALLGDSRADARASRRAGVVMIGLAQSTEQANALQRSGARVVYRDASDFRAHLETALRRVSPGAVRFDRGTMERLVREALAVAEENLRQCRVPVGAVVARGDGVVIARGRDLTDTHGRVAHAELEVLRAASPMLPVRDTGAILVSTREPCVMCTAAAAECNIDTIIFARPDARSGGTRRVTPSTGVRVGARHDFPRVVGGILAEESARLHERFMLSLEPKPVRGAARSVRTRHARVTDHVGARIRATRERDIPALLMQHAPAILLAASLLLTMTGCKKAYKCPEVKDTSQLQKWKDLGFTTDAPGITVCEASEQNFSAAVPTPPSVQDAAKSLDATIKSAGWRDTPAKDFVPRTDDKGMARRYEKCGVPQNPLGERYLDCVGMIAIQIDALPAQQFPGNPYLLWADYRPDLKIHHPLGATENP